MGALVAVGMAGWLWLAATPESAASLPPDVTPSSWLTEHGVDGSLPPEPPDTVPEGVRPWWRTVHGTYQLRWQGEGDRSASRGWLRHELTASWHDVGLSLEGHWEGADIAQGDPGKTGLRLGWQGGPDGAASSKGADAAGQAPSLIAAVRSADVRFGMRPLPSGDPFRMFYPESGEVWRRAFHVQAEGRLRLPSSSLPGTEAHGQGSGAGGGLSWQAAFQRADGSRRDDSALWWRWSGETWQGRARWRFTHVSGNRGGKDGYRAWALDGRVSVPWADVRAGYAQLQGEHREPFRAAGFARVQSRRWRGWTVTAEGYRRDEGFRLPVGGDLTWREGMEGGLLRLQYALSRWQWLWETWVHSPLPTLPALPGGGSSGRARTFRRDLAYQLTWRPPARWWVRLRHEASVGADRERYEAQVRWPRSGVSLLTRYDVVPTPRWLWRWERTWGSRRARLDWDQQHAAWRVDYRRTWTRWTLRMVVKERESPGGPPGQRQSFVFAEGGYRHPRGWGLTATVGWDDRGRIDFHWNRPLRWQLAWDTVF